MNQIFAATYDVTVQHYFTKITFCSSECQWNERTISSVCKSIAPMLKLAVTLIWNKHYLII